MEDFESSPRNLRYGLYDVFGDICLGVAPGRKTHKRYVIKALNCRSKIIKINQVKRRLRINEVRGGPLSICVVIQYPTDPFVH